MHFLYVTKSRNQMEVAKNKFLLFLNLFYIKRAY